jgi:putative phosphoribosyl transferase
MKRRIQTGREELVTIPAGRTRIEGSLEVPDDAPGVVVFAHGSGSGRFSPRNQYVARVLREAGFGTLLIDLLTAEEEREEDRGAQLRFDIELLAKRLMAAADWLAKRGGDKLGIGYFGASTGAGAALLAAAAQTHTVRAVVSRGGRPDLAGAALAGVRAPTLLIVGGNDPVVIDLNREALEALACREKQLVIVPGATHLFEEPGTLERVAELASEWFERYMGAAFRTH